MSKPYEIIRLSLLILFFPIVIVIQIIGAVFGVHDPLFPGYFEWGKEESIKEQVVPKNNTKINGKKVE